MIVREKSKLMLFVGQDPTGKAGVIKKTIGELSQNELRAWYIASPKNVEQHVIFTPEKKTYEPSKEIESSNSEQEQA